MRGQRDSNEKSNKNNSYLRNRNGDNFSGQGALANLRAFEGTAGKVRGFGRRGDARCERGKENGRDEFRCGEGRGGWRVGAEQGRAGSGRLLTRHYLQAGKERVTAFRQRPLDGYDRMTNQNPEF